MQHAPSLLDILAHIPLFVWGILAAIVAMGVRMSRPMTMAPKRVVVVPLIWLAFGIWGVNSTSGLFSVAGLAWAVGIATGITVIRGIGWPGQVSFDAATDRFHVGGSWFPLVVMLSIFVMKAYVGITLAVHPDVAHQIGFIVVTSAAFGLLSGCFLGRSINILSARPRGVAAVAV
ncbi:DUF6622 family protein [Roseateles chitosanitabidus]|jgi:hypothetical protein|uniref:DUF6622 family protein n=1 Tax=Roseateles chitosanitabidus TaxID=65048 RepID=UPI0008306A20|nr:DUF6622 family protein [Roseateles chitosanitabidus]